MNCLRAVATVKRHPCAILLLAQLLAQLLALVLYPFVEDTDSGRIVVSLLIGLTLLERKADGAR